MVRLVYILAASHSGSTLLAMLLNAHPEICTAGELKATNLGNVERYRCSCGELIRQCPFWARVRLAMYERGIEFDITDARTDFRGVEGALARRLLQPLHRGAMLERLRDAALWLSPAWRRRYPEIQSRNAGLAAVIRDLSAARIVVDSAKVGLRLKFLLRNPELDVRVIRLIRDGRAVALTYMDPAGFADAGDPSLRGGGMGGDRRDERLTMAEAAHQWRRSNEEAEALLSGLDPACWIEVRYEDLCRKPAETLGRLFTFLGVDPALAERDFRKAEHHILGNGMRLDTTAEIRLDERWKSALTPEDLRVFDRVAGKMNRLYQYE